MSIKICSIGECMIEISNDYQNNYKQSFAGDTFNFAVYLSKKKIKVDFLSAIGKDQFSRDFLSFSKKKNISNQLIEIHPNKELGLYLIKNKFNGEKEFHYWRNNSAARYFFNNCNYDNLFKKIMIYDYIYFSGITLSIIDKINQIKFYKFLKKLKKHNVQILFDLNIRNKNWFDQKYLKNTIFLYLPLVDILFATGEDMNNLIKNNNLDFFQNLIQKNNIYHAIYRFNASKNYSFYKNQIYTICNKKIDKIIDSSGAGDGFNAYYFSTYLNTANIKRSLLSGHLIGKRIIMQKGAII